MSRWIVAGLAALWLGGVGVATLAHGGPSGEAGGGSSWLRTRATVDALVGARLAAEDAAPAARSDDAEFLRRIHLDLTGTVPTGEEAEAFAKDPSPEKRLLKVEELLASPAHADYWGFWWFKTLTGLANPVGRRDGQGARLLRGENGETFRTWLETQVAENRPYDRFAYDLLTATGRTDENGATGFYARWEGKPNDLAGATAKVFLGLRIQCAQCHDHVYEPTWKQTDFQGMAAFYLTSFPRRVEIPDPERGRPRYAADVQEIDPVRYAGRAKERTERRGRELPPELQERLDLAAVTPKLWHSSATPDVTGIPRRMLLARWITAKDNPYFARAVVNRYWGHFFGRGIVHPVDDFSSFNAPSHPEVLDLLAKDLVENGYDLRRLIRILVNTEAYQRSSRGPVGEDAAPAPDLFARAAVRPLATDQTYLSLLRATGADQRMDRISRGQNRRAQQGLFAGFSFVFDDDEMSEHEDFQGSIPQGLFLMNAPFLQAAISARGGTTLQGVLSRERRDEDRVRRLYLAAYGREPSAEESRGAVAFVRKGEGPGAYEDLFWSLLNSAEFMTNH